VHDEGYLRGWDKACESEPVSQAEFFDLCFYFFCKAAVADKEPVAVVEFSGELFCRFDYKVVALEVEQPGNGGQYYCIGSDVDFFSKGGDLLIWGRGQVLLFFDGRIGGEERFVGSDAY